jgi:hypothetical protein
MTVPEVPLATSAGGPDVCRWRDDSGERDESPLTRRINCDSARHGTARH